MNEPFDDVVATFRISDVMSETSFHKLKSDVPFITLQQISTDLCQFEQSRDLDELIEQHNLPPSVCKFMEILKTNVKQTVEKIFKLPIGSKVTATVSKYSKGDYLLCHDDLLNTRAVAFVYYLNNLTKEDGGNLNFFAHDQNKDPLVGCYDIKVEPHENSMVLFRVNEISHHEVEQMYTNTERWSINGWFHHLDPVDDVIYVPRLFRSQPVELTAPIAPIMALNRIISNTFMIPEVLEEMATHMKDRKDMALVVHNVLPTDFFDLCKLELADSDDFLWELKGPANYRRYEVLPYEVEGPHIWFGESLFNIGNLVDYLMSTTFLKALSKIASVNFAQFEDTCFPTCMLEVQRWKEGSYSVLCDNNIERERPTIEVTVFFQVNENMIGSVSSDTDVSGLTVHSIKPPMLTEKDLNELYEIKFNRIWNAYVAAKEKHTRAQRKAVWDGVGSIVEEKIDKLQTYRRYGAPVNTFITPEDNTMIITHGSSTMSRYTSYMKKNDAVSDPQLCYYSVSVTYFTAD